MKERSTFYSISHLSPHGPSLSLPGGPPSTHSRRRDEQKASGEVVAAMAWFAFVLRFRIILAIISPLRLSNLFSFPQIKIP